MSEFSFDAVIDRMKSSLGLKTDAEVAQVLGMKPSAFSNRRATRSVPYEEIIGIAAIRDLNLVYVLTGENKYRPVIAAGAMHAAREPDQSEFVEVPLYDVRAAAGFGAFIHEEPVIDALAFRRDWIDRQFGAQPRDLRLLYIVGDSMEPALSDGDVIMIDRAQNKARADGLYVLRYDDSLVVKKVQRLPGGMVKIFSENPAYEPATLHSLALDAGEGATVIGRVVWGARKL